MSHRTIPIRTAPTLRQWLLGSIMLATIAVGWAVPLVGLVVPLVMATAIAVSFRRGRHACGHLCPRGNFYDSWFRPFGGGRDVPAALRKPAVRWSIFAVLMGFMAWQISRNPTEIEHWGFTFWLACAVTTAFGIVLGVVYQGRAWCTLCPIGTLTAKTGEGKHLLIIDAECKACGLCERHCPMELAIATHREAGQLPHGDCIKCASCSKVCPQAALSWPKAA